MTQPQQFDLLIRAERLFCSATNRDGPGEIALKDGRIAAVEQRVVGNAHKTLSFPDTVVVPGLLDLHAHPANRDSVFGIAPDEHMLPHGVTSVLSQGDVGADDCQQYLDHTITRSETRVRLALNLSRVGETKTTGCFENLRDADVDRCIAAIDSHRQAIWGLAVNVSHMACGPTDPRQILERGLQVAAACDIPILFGMRRAKDWALQEQLESLRPGDVVTYCYRRQPHCIVSQGQVLPEIQAARDRGILFDLGHGAASFDFDVAQTAIAKGFTPDTISTDLQRRHLDMAPRHTLPRTMSKLKAAGMQETDILTAVSQTPASVMRVFPQTGCLKPGTTADLAILKWSEFPETLEDASGNLRFAHTWSAIATIRNGRVIHPPSRPD
ncbi:MAG: hypothetical protein CMJ75_21305 [Planctomycetaceae bacterium]|nr:hypothetical protein [Planctomycetaceae bacterium]